MDWIYLSPHLDDVVLSCGGLVWEQTRSGKKVSILSIFAGDPPEGVPLSPYAEMHHIRWQTGIEAVSIRREEDRRACAILGAVPDYWTAPDCLYRLLPDGSYLVLNRDQLFQPYVPEEEPLVNDLTDWLSTKIVPGAQVVSPLTLGGHRDHRIVRVAAERLGIPLWYYADYPYVVEDAPGASVNQADAMRAEGWECMGQQVSADGLKAWQQGVAAYASQISTFWGSLAEMEQALHLYWSKGGGTCLWRCDRSPFPALGT
ncbi:MAG TPA: PIG-L family deacetylase [Anaerolineaceae bacterium]